MRRRVAPLLAFTALLTIFGCPGPTGPESNPESSFIRGRVFDSFTGAPVPGAEIQFGELHALSNADGRFSLDLGTEGGTRVGAWSLHKNGYQFLYIEELEVDAGRSWEVALPTALTDPSEYIDHVTVQGEVFDSTDAEIPDDSQITLVLLSTDGARDVLSDLSYAGQYVFSTPVSGEDCLLIALVEPSGGEPFLTMAAGLDLSGTAAVQHDLTSVAAGATQVTVTPAAAGCLGMCYFVTKYGYVPGFFAGHPGEPPDPVLPFESAAAKDVLLLNPFDWEQVMWVQSEEQADFAGQPDHVKICLSTSAIQDLSAGMTLPPPDRSLGPTEGVDPGSLAYANRAISLDPVAGADYYTYTLQAGDGDGPVLGRILAASAELLLPAWLLEALCGGSVHLCLQVIACDPAPPDLLYLAFGELPADLALAVVGSAETECYEAVMEVGAGEVEIGLE